MSGHSKWSTIKHQKGAKDARRGKLFARLSTGSSRPIGWKAFTATCNGRSVGGRRTIQRAPVPTAPMTSSTRR